MQKKYIGSCWPTPLLNGWQLKTFAQIFGFSSECGHIFRFNGHSFVLWGANDVEVRVQRWLFQDCFEINVRSFMHTSTLSLACPLGGYWNLSIERRNALKMVRNNETALFLMRWHLCISEMLVWGYGVCNLECLESNYCEGQQLWKVLQPFDYSYCLIALKQKQCRSTRWQGAKRRVYTYNPFSGYALKSWCMYGTILNGQHYCTTELSKPKILRDEGHELCFVWFSDSDTKPINHHFW